MITGAVAIVAGLGGATLSGYFNRKNTMDTLAAARETTDDQWMRTQEREHRAWLRDNRQESYVAFFDEVEKMITRLRKGDTEHIALSDLDAVESLRGRIRLIGTDQLRIQSREVHLLLGQTVIARNVYARVIKQTTDDRISDTEREREAALRWKAKLANVTTATTEFVNLVREELGTAEAKDEEDKGKEALQSSPGASLGLVVG